MHTPQEPPPDEISPIKPVPDTPPPVQEPIPGDFPIPIQEPFPDSDPL